MVNVLVVFGMMYGGFAIYDRSVQGPVWSLAGYHDRVGYLAVVGAWLTALVFLIKTFVKRPKKPQGETGAE
jgi:hypothetical protein